MAWSACVYRASCKASVRQMCVWIVSVHVERVGSFVRAGDLLKMSIEVVTSLLFFQSQFNPHSLPNWTTSLLIYHICILRFYASASHSSQFSLYFTFVGIIKSLCLSHPQQQISLRAKVADIKEGYNRLEPPIITQSGIPQVHNKTICFLVPTSSQV